MSRLAAKGHDDSVYTIVIAVLHWVKPVIIAQKLTSVVEIWALLSSRWLPLLVDRSCDVTYLCARWHNDDAAKRYSVCERVRGLNYYLRESFKIQPVTSLQESCKLLIAYNQLLLSQSAKVSKRSE